MDKSTILILCLLGDPAVPAASCDRAGGFNVDMQEILRYWSVYPYEIVVITNTSPMFLTPSEKLYPNITLYRIDIPAEHLNHPNSLHDDYDSVMEQIRTCLHSNYVFPKFIHSYYWYSGRVALQLSKEYKIPFIHSVVALSADKKRANSKNFNKVQFIYENEFLPYASLVLSITNEEQKILIDFYSCDKNKTLVTGRSVDVAFSTPDHDDFGLPPQLVPSQTDELIQMIKIDANMPWWHQGAFVYVGRLKQEKGLDTIIRAWYKLYKRIGNRLMPLWIIGGYPVAIDSMRQQLLGDCPDLPILEQQLKICWWGYLTPPSMNALFMKAAVLVTHSQYEAGGRVIIEALSVGVPVIATPTGFAADLIEDWVNGFLIPYGQEELLANRMEFFSNQPLLSNSLGLCAQDTFKEAYHSWRYYEKHKYVYEHFMTNNNQKINLLKIQQKDFNIQQLNNYFQKKMIHTFPFENSVEKNEVLKYYKKHFKNYDVSATYSEELSLHSRIYLLSLPNKKGIVKHFYSRLNSSKIWFYNKDCRDAQSCAELLKNANICGNSSVVLTPEDMDYCCHCYWLPLLEIVSPTDMLIYYKEILYIIYQFNTNKDIAKKSGGNLCLTLNSLWKFVKSGSQAYQEYLSKNHNHWDKLNLSTGKKGNSIGISFGKIFSTHICKHERTFLLLPSSDIYKCELGLDAAIYFLEIWYDLYLHCQNTFGLKKMHQYICTLYSISSDNLSQWCIALWLLAIKKSFTLMDQEGQNTYSNALKAYCQWLF